jgi:hypothetical protein
MATDERGLATRTPFGVLHQSAEKKDSYFLMWLVPGEEVSPAEHTPYPSKVVRTALTNAGSIASLMLTTEALVSEIPEEKKGAPAPGGQGGMGDMY